MNDFLIDFKSKDLRTPPAEPLQPDGLARRPLRSTLLFMVMPATLAVSTALLELRMPPALLYGIALLLGLALLLRSFFDPEWLLAVTVLYIPLSRVYVAPIAPGLNGTNLILLMLVFCWLVRAVAEERQFFLSLPNSKLVGAFALVTAFSAVTSIMAFGLHYIVEDQLRLFKSWIDQFILFFAVLNLIRDGAMARRVVLYMMLGMLVVMLLGAREWLDKLGFDSIEKSRVLGPQLQPNDFGAFLVYGSAPFVALFLVFIRKIWAWLMLPFFLSLAKLLLVTFSRGAYVAMMLVGVAAGYLRGKLFLLAWSVVAAAALVAMPELIPDAMMDRMAQTSDGAGPVGEMDSSSENRLVLWGAALDMTLESPVLGKGFKGFSALKSNYTSVPVRETDPHNMFLYISSQMGIPALLLFLVILYRLNRMGARLYRDARDPFARAIGMGAAAMAIGIVAVNMFGSRMVSIECSGYVWIYLAVLAHLWLEQEHRMADVDERARH